MVTSPRKVVQEYIFHVEGMEESLKARITLDIEPIEQMGAYSWDISHLWHTQGGPYCPSTTHGKTFDEVENLLMAYAMSFVTELGFSKNKFY